MLIDLEELAGEIASKVDGAGLTPVIENERSPPWVPESTVRIHLLHVRR